MKTKLTSKDIIHLFDAKGNMHGVLLSPDAWEIVKDTINSCCQDDPKSTECPEPIEDWKTLLAYWDFNYPCETSVHCDHCDNQTDNWETDEPRKFRLMAANFGGLVRFQCLQCDAIIIKRHFKDQIKVECTPKLD